MRGTLKELLTKLTSDKPTTSYVEDVAAALASTARWTCPADGLIVARVVSSGGIVGYYIYDVTAGDKPICNLYDNERYNNTASTTCFPVIKGHVYRQAYYAGQMREALYYRFGMGGVLHSSIFKAFSDFTSHLFGGDVDERISRKIVGEHTLTTDIDNAIACIKWIINYDIHSVRKHQRLQATDSHGILYLQQQLDDSNRCGRIPIKYERTLSLIRDRIQHLQSCNSLCVRHKHQNNFKGFGHCWCENNRRQITALDRGCVA